MRDPDDAPNSPRLGAKARRNGDPVPLPGDYQHRALTEGRPIQRRWHEMKLELLDWFFTPAAGERILDVGCGSGVFANRLAKLGAQVTAVDSNAKAVEYGERTFARDNLEFRRGLLDELGLPDDSFDAAVCLKVIEHVYPAQTDALLADLRRDGGPGRRAGRADFLTARTNHHRRPMTFRSGFCSSPKLKVSGGS